MNMHQIYQKLPTNEDCLLHLEQVRWGVNRPARIVKGQTASLFGEQKTNGGVDGGADIAASPLA